MKLEKITTIYRIQIEPFNIVQKAIFHLKKIISKRQCLMEGERRKEVLFVYVYERGKERRKKKVSSRASPLPLNIGYHVCGKMRMY